MSDLPPRRVGSGDQPRRTSSAKSSNTRWILLGVVGGGFAVLLICGGGLVALLLPAVQQARTAAWRSQFKNNLKQVGLGAHNFHDVHGQFPLLLADGSVDPNITSPISFNTAILPFLEHAPLYGQIDTTIPWDDPANTNAYKAQPPVFISPLLDPETSSTSTGLGATHLVANSQLVEESGLMIREITDGTSNTILAGGIDESAVPAWGDPGNSRDAANGFGGGANAFGGVPEVGAMVLLADGSVRLISTDIDPETARRLACPDDGQIVGAF